MLSVVMPIYNENRTLREIVQKVLREPTEKELILVDDGSTDGSRETLQQLENEPRIRVLYRDRNSGKGAALRLGFAEARGEIVIVQDADLEYDPAEYPKLIQPILDGKADVVFGSRFAGGESHRVLYFWHYVGNRIVTLASNMLTNLNLTDVETGFKAFRSEVIQSVSIEEDRFGVEPEITARVSKGRWRVYEVGISYSGRTYEEGKKIGWTDGLWAIACVLKYNLFR
jgi:glycosyltransferase involved in cell wall biosynthesis